MNDDANNHRVWLEMFNAALVGGSNASAATQIADIGLAAFNIRFPWVRWGSDKSRKSLVRGHTTGESNNPKAEPKQES